MSTLKYTDISDKFLDIFSHLQYEYLVAGVVGGTVSTLMLHPFDLIKVRFAVNDGHSGFTPHYTGSIDAVRKIVKSEGVSGLYRGVVPNVLGSGASWGFYFLLYNCLKTWMQDGNTTKALSPWVHTFAAVNAGVITLVMTNPIWVVKTRLCLQYGEDHHLSDSKKYTGTMDALRKIHKTEGIKGLYKGLTPGLFGVSHGTLQFVAYEEMKTQYNLFKNNPVNGKLGTMEYIVFATISKLIAATVTYPYQVIRARLQDQHHHYKGPLHCIRNIFKYEGWRGFYKGLSVNLLKVTPATVLTFVVYEHISYYLLNLEEKAIDIDSNNSTIIAKSP